MLCPIQVWKHIHSLAHCPFFCHMLPLIGSCNRCHWWPSAKRLAEAEQPATPLSQPAVHRTRAREAAQNYALRSEPFTAWKLAHWMRPRRRSCSTHHWMSPRRRSCSSARKLVAIDGSIMSPPPDTRRRSSDMLTWEGEEEGRISLPPSRPVYHMTPPSACDHDLRCLPTPPALTRITWMLPSSSASRAPGAGSVSGSITRKGTKRLAHH